MIWAIAYIATIFGANWALEHYGIVGIGFGLSAPAGVLFADLHSRSAICCRSHGADGGH